MDTADSYLFLQKLYFAIYASFMQVYPYMLSLCRGGYQETRSYLRPLSDRPPNFALPSLGRKRLRSCPLKSRLSLDGLESLEGFESLESLEFLESLEKLE